MSGEFDLGKCPEITNLLQAVQDFDNGSTAKPDITCSQSCVDLFKTLGESCNAALNTGFRNAENPAISEYSIEFFDKCDALENSQSIPSPTEPMTSPLVEEPSAEPMTSPLVEEPSAESPDNGLTDIRNETPNEPSSSLAAKVRGSPSQLQYFTHGHRFYKMPI